MKKQNKIEKELLRIYELTKKRGRNGVFEHPFLEPTPCPYCGNYRLDFGGEVFECPQQDLCGKYWDKKVQFKLLRPQLSNFNEN